MLKLEVLVCELLAVDGLATSAVSPGEVTTLDHEVGNDAVESRALIPEAALSGGESLEVVRRARHLVAVETDDDLADVLARRQGPRGEEREKRAFKINRVTPL